MTTVNKIVISNKLNKSRTNMSLSCTKMFEFALSKFESQKGTEGVILRTNDLFEIIGKKSHQKNQVLKKVIDELRETYFYICDSDNNEKAVKPIQEIKWLERFGEVDIRFSNEILPYITDLKKKFTQYSFENIRNLNSKYAVILYKYLIEKFNIYQKYKTENEGISQVMENYAKPLVSVKKLRMLTNTCEKYRSFSSFEKSVLDKAVNEINKKTNILVKCIKKRSNRYITDIQFSISSNKKNIIKNKSISFDSLDDQNQKRNKLNQKIINALNSKYLKYLVEANLLKPDDFLGTRVLKDLANNVFPLYQRIEEKPGFGCNELKRHIEYVSNKKRDEGMYNDNIAEYLRVSVQNYMEKKRI